MRKIIVAFSVLWLMVSCAEVPVTGRRQLKLVSDSELNAQSFAAYKQFLQENKVVQSSREANMVKEVGTRIQRAVEMYMRQNNLTEQIAGYKWEFNLVQDQNVNAWCMPGGKVVVYSGILPVAQDEAGLAVVMGHEIAHAIAAHGNERASQGLLSNGLLQGGSILAGQNPTLTKQIIMQAAGVGTQLGLLAYGRNQESEADHIGLIFMAMAGYDPNAAVPFWQRMSKAGGASPPEFLSTHPSPETRIKDLEKLIPKAMKYYQKGGV
ncbi:M48 family metallopeptidase [Rhodocytophaga aerolata]|uniref:M48 family metallopeptidase n=1 Tax=Rhodocytophaga aerolata TaxID=455078 RepID=A0ABT8R9U8_9BACT|nr:M48 family metallopeptidase [Rhodocytophaga aerolata]MDO1448119.1 M48 family metallopeptidase [Rhodocytophaga aerolata]